LVITSIYYSRITCILVPVHKWVEHGVHTICICGYPLPIKKLKLKITLYFIKLNLGLITVLVL